jgi:hypothetical protein
MSVSSTLTSIACETLRQQLSDRRRLKIRMFAVAAMIMGATGEATGRRLDTAEAMRIATLCHMDT